METITFFDDSKICFLPKVKNGRSEEKEWKQKKEKHRPINRLDVERAIEYIN